MRVLITGMSGTGKTALVSELRERGYTAVDADSDGFIERRADGRWEWQVAQVAALLETQQPLLFLAGCSVEQGRFAFDLKVLLTAPDQVILERLRTRTTNSFGRDPVELVQVLQDLEEVEPQLRRSADLVVETTVPVDQVADLVLGAVAGARPPS